MMNEYGFDYMNYLNSVPNYMNYNPSQKANINYMTTQPLNSQKTPDLKMATNSQILEANQGFIRGNMFGNLYDPYKNYKPMDLNPENEKEALLYQVMQYQFALTDLDLYLDIYPNDRNAVSLYNQYLTIMKQARDKYENMYGPLTLDSNYLGTNHWKWKNNPWPWEGV